MLGVGLELGLEARVLGLEVVDAGVELGVGREPGLELRHAVVERGLGREARLEEGELAGDLVHEALGVRLVHEVLLHLAELLTQTVQRLLVDGLEGGDTVGRRLLVWV